VGQLRGALRRAAAVAVRFACNRHGREGEFDVSFPSKGLLDRAAPCADDEPLAGRSSSSSDLNSEIAEILDTLHL
jgi:hypothetical protein